MKPPVGWKDIRGVSFDAAGTLLHPYPSVGHIYREIARAHGCEYSAAALNQAFRPAFKSVVKNTSLNDAEGRERDFWHRVVRQTFESAAAEVPNFELVFANLWEAFAHADRWRVNADAVSTLQTLRSRGYRLAVISNWDRRLHTVLHETGLRGFLDAVIISSEAGSEKPQPEIFRRAEEALEMNPNECLHIGDNQYHDLEGARAAGWSARLVRHNDTAPTANEIGGLAQLPMLLPGPAPRFGRQVNL